MEGPEKPGHPSEKEKKNNRLDFLEEKETLIIGVDIGSQKHYARAVNLTGYELSKKPLGFDNSAAGFEEFYNWMAELAVRYKKVQIVVGLEPTGVYWFDLWQYLTDHKITVFTVNTYAVKQTKEVGCNSSRKDDRKDPILIANLVKNGDYTVPYVPEGVFSDIHGLQECRDRNMEDCIRSCNRLSRMVALYCPEIADVYPDLKKKSCLVLLSTTPIPEDMVRGSLGEMRQEMKAEGFRGRSYSCIEKILDAVKESIGFRHGKDSAVQNFREICDDIRTFQERIDRVEEQMEALVAKIPHSDRLLGMCGIGTTIAVGILSEIGDINRFSSASEIQKIAGLEPVACSSGKHTGQTRISKRGRKRLRYWLVQAAISLCKHTMEFGELLRYYMEREQNPLKRNQAYVAVACKFIRIMFVLLTREDAVYDPSQVTAGIRWTGNEACSVKTA